MNQKQILQFFITLFFFLCLTDCSSPNPIRLGFCAELTGKHAVIGTNARDSAQLAVDKINAEGGINGIPIQMIVRDNKSALGTTRQIMENLYHEGIVAVIAQIMSEQTAEAMPFMNEKKWVLLSSASTSVEFSGKKDFFFRVVPDTDAMGSAFADFLHKTYAYSGYTGVYDTSNRAFTEPLLEAIDDRLKKYQEKVEVFIPYESGKDDLHTIADQIVTDQPKGVIIVASIYDTAMLAQYIRQRGLQADLFGSVWAHNNLLIEKGGRAVQGMILFSINSTFENSPAYQEYYNRFFNRYQRPPALDSFHAYEAVNIMALALQHTGGKAEGLPEALLGIHDFPGVLGNISFDAYGDVKRDVYIVKVDGDHFQTIEVIPPNH